MKLAKKDTKTWGDIPLTKFYVENPKRLNDPERIRKIMW